MHIGIRFADDRSSLVTSSLSSPPSSWGRQPSLLVVVNVRCYAALVVSSPAVHTHTHTHTHTARQYCCSGRDVMMTLTSVRRCISCGARRMTNVTYDETTTLYKRHISETRRRQFRQSRLWRRAASQVEYNWRHADGRGRHYCKPASSAYYHHAAARHWHILVAWDCMAGRPCCSPPGRPDCLIACLPQLYAVYTEPSACRLRSTRFWRFCSGLSRPSWADPGGRWVRTDLLLRYVGVHQNRLLSYIEINDHFGSIL